MNAPRFEIYKDLDDEFRWRLRAANGEIVASSEAYTSEADARRGVETAQRLVAIAPAEAILVKGGGVSAPVQLEEGT